jgi:hypothetical protein
MYWTWIKATAILRFTDQQHMESKAKAMIKLTLIGQDLFLHTKDERK